MYGVFRDSHGPLKGLGMFGAFRDLHGCLNGFYQSERIGGGASEHRPEWRRLWLLN